MKIVIIGASGFGAEVAWVCRRAGIDVIGYCDDAESKLSGEFERLPLLGTIEHASETFGVAVHFHVAVGNNRARKQLAERAGRQGWMPVTVVDPSANCAPDAVLGDGCYVGIGSVISRGSTLGRQVIVNHQVTVGHDCIVEDYAQLCPGVRVSGGCRINEGALLGSNGVMIPGRTVGAWATLGAGGIALHDIPDGESQVRLR